METAKIRELEELNERMRVEFIAKAGLTVFGRTGDVVTLGYMVAILGEDPDGIERTAGRGQGQGHRGGARQLRGGQETRGGVETSSCGDRKRLGDDRIPPTGTDQGGREQQGG